MKKIVLFIFLFIPILINASSINNMYIDTEIDISGNLIVKEIVDFDDVLETFNIYYKNDVGDEVYYASDIILDYIGYLDSYDDVDKVYTDDFKSDYTIEYKDYTIDKTNEYLNIKFNDKKVYYLEYRILNICVRHNDSAELYYKIFKGFNYDINNGYFLVKLPESSNYFKLTASSNGDIKAGKDIDKGIALFRIDKLEKNNDFDIRLFYDKSLYPICVNKSKQTNKNMNDYYGRAYLTFTVCAVLVVLIILIVLGYIIIVNDKYKVKSKKIKKSKRIVLLSDLHDRKINEKLVKMINKAKPDIIVFAGDMIEGAYTSESEFNKHTDYIVDLINKLSNYEIYYTYGNHEHYLGKEYLNKFERILSKSNVKFLNNKKVNIDGINLIGLDLDLESYKKNKLSKDKIINKIGDINENEFNLLVAHNPIPAKNYSEIGVDLTISGHIHGGVIRLPFALFSPAFRLFPRYNSGLYNVNHMKLIVSKGLGFVHYLPIRVNCYAEIVTIDLLNEE